MRRRFPLLASAVALSSASTAGLAQAEPVELGEIVVTAAGFEQNFSDAPASISVISGEELAKKSYKSIVDAVNNIPGVYVTGGGGAQDISIRGMDDSYTLYLGRRPSGLSGAFGKHQRPGRWQADCSAAHLHDRAG